MKKIIILHESFFRKHRDMGISLFKERGYDVDLWSTVKIKYNKRLDEPTDQIEDKVLYLKNHFDIVRQIKQQDWKHTILFITTTAHRGGIEDFVRIVVSLAGGRYCNFIYEILPVGPIIEKDPQYSIMSIIYEVYAQKKEKIYQRIISEKCTPLYCFVPTYYATKELLTDMEKKVYVEVHNKDYDDYILSNIIPENPTEEFIVFLDTEMVNGEDFRKNNRYVYKDGKIYYKRLNTFFDRIERIFHTRVVIAAHPKSEFKGDEFDGREIVYYRTAELIRRAKLVLLHCSVAVNYVVLYSKPFIILLDSDIRCSFIYNYILKPQMYELRAIPYHFDIMRDDIITRIKYPDSYYKDYIRHYINNSKNDNRLFYEIVEEKIRDLI